MLKKISLLALPLVLAGCTSTFTNLTPTRQVRNTENLYPVEVQFNSQQQTLRWHTLKPFVQVGDNLLPMRPTPLMKNRWEGLVPVPKNAKGVEYRYKFDYEFNTFGPVENGSALSKKFELNILDK